MFPSLLSTFESCPIIVFLPPPPLVFLPFSSCISPSPESSTPFLTSSPDRSRPSSLVFPFPFFSSPSSPLSPCFSASPYPLSPFHLSLITGTSPCMFSLLQLEFPHHCFSLPVSIPLVPFLTSSSLNRSLPLPSFSNLLHHCLSPSLSATPLIAPFLNTSQLLPLAFLSSPLSPSPCFPLFSPLSALPVFVSPTPSPPSTQHSPLVVPLSSPLEFYDNLSLVPFVPSLTSSHKHSILLSLPLVFLSLSPLPLHHRLSILSPSAYSLTPSHSTQFSSPFPLFFSLFPLFPPFPYSSLSQILPSTPYLP